MTLKLIKHWEIDIIIMPILRMKKLRLRDSQLEVAEPGASLSSSGWPRTHLVYNHGLCIVPIIKRSLGLLDPNRHALREHLPCLAGVYYLKWTLTGQGKACMDMRTNSSSKTKNTGLKKEMN